MTRLLLNEPQSGYYWRRFVRGGVKVPVHIWHGAPIDPVTGEELERSHRWQARIGGGVIGKTITDETEILETWISCAGNPITQAEYDVMIGKTRETALGDVYTADITEQSPPEDDPYQAVDLRSKRPILPPKRR